MASVGVFEFESTALETIDNGPAGILSKDRGDFFTT